MIKRNHNLLLYQNIKWEHVAQYLDNLKSRKYKAFIQKFHIYTLQNHLVNFPLLILLSCKHENHVIDSQLNSFELGYLFYCFSSIRHVDISFFYYYRNSFDLKLFKFVKCLVIRVHYLLIFLSLQVYGNYLKYLCNIFYYSSYKQDIELQKYESSLVLEFKSLINSVSLSIFFNKIYFDRDLISCILNFFDLSTFSRFLLILNIKSDFLFLHNNTLLSKLKEVVILQFTYEILSLLYRFYNFQYIHFRAVFFDQNSQILLIYNEALEERLVYLLLNNGLLTNIVKSFRKFSLVQGLFNRYSFYVIDYCVYPSFFISQPSLYSQFIFMKQISLMIHQINRQSLFVINIRLNMLFVLWLSQYKILAKRIVYLLDYLIDLKLRSYYINYRYLIVKLFQKPFFSRTILIKRIYFYSSVYSEKYKKYYGLLKLLWGVYFKCYMNLREAI